MATSEERNYVLPSGLIIGFIIGLALDIYEVNAFGDVGLGVVFGPMIGVLIGAIYTSFFVKEKHSSEE